MKRDFVTSAVVLALVLALGGTAMVAQQTFTGTLSDSMCGKKHMMPGKSDAECTRECIKANSSYALVVGDKVYKLVGDSKRFDSLAGSRVTVTGEVKGDTVTVASVAEAKK